MLSLPLDLLNASFLLSIYVHRRFWHCITAHTTEFSINSLVLFCFLHHYRQMGRPPCCDRSNVKKGLWTAEEDAKILAYVSSHGVGNWTLVPQKAGLNRCGKSCRLRWTNYLRPDLKHESFSPQEEELIINLHEAIGSRWSLIAKQLPGRTDNDVKNHWNTKLRKKLQKMGIDPVTHKPISQVITEFGNLKDNSNAGNQVASFSKRSSTDLVAWPETSHVFTGQVQDDSFLIKPYTWDYFVQPAVINHETKEPRRCFNDVSSCCSSTSSSQSYSCQQPQAQITPSSPLMWSEFLLPDPALSSDFLQQEENHNGVPSEEGLVSDNCGATNGNQATRHANAPSPASSFVDSILDKDEEMRSQFPQLLDPSFDY